MKKTDARKMNQDMQYHMRVQVVKLRQRGMKHAEISEIVGIHEKHSSRIYRRYEREGIKGLAKGRRGRRADEQKTLTPDMETAIRKEITDKTPDQLKMPFALWTRKAVAELIRLRCGIAMPIRTVGEYLMRWGFTPQKPIRKAYEQNPSHVEKWLGEEYPAISARAKAEGAEISWCDETGIRNDESNARGYALKGKTPVIRLCAKRTSMSMISAITNQGKVRFMVYKDAMNATLFVRFMGRLVRDAGRKVFLIVDNLRTHHGKVVRKWLDEHAEKIEVFYLPSYSPELNPDEYLNCDFKCGVHGGVPARSEKELKRKMISHMRMLQRKPGRVVKYFKHPKIKYAA
jgi:transposase